MLHQGRRFLLAVHRAKMKATTVRKATGAWPRVAVFCERHGPFDPRIVCPYCVIEDEQRRLYGPPPKATPRHEPPAIDRSPPPDAPPPEDVDGFTALAPQDEPEADGQDAPPAPLGWLVVKRPIEQRGTILALAPNQSIGREGDIRWDDRPVPPARTPDAGAARRRADAPRCTTSGRSRRPTRSLSMGARSVARRPCVRMTRSGSEIRFLFLRP